MDPVDDDLNELLKPLLDLSPNDLQLQKWQAAVAGETLRGRRLVTKTRRGRAFQLVAAASVGFFVGAFMSKSFSSSPTQNKNLVTTEISAANATLENSHTNLD